MTRINKNHKKVVVVTGASAGLGRAIVMAYAKRKWRIGLLSRDSDRLNHLKAEVEKLGGMAIAITCDVSEYDQVENATIRIENALGPIDIWINNAMVTIFSSFEKILPAEYARVTNITYHGYVWGTLCALKSMKQRNKGTIIQVGSALAYRSIPLQSAYCGAKHAIKGFTDSLRSELLHEKINIHLCMVQMPALNTPQFDWGRNKMGQKSQPVPPIYQPEVGAEAVYWSSQNRKREVNVGIRVPIIIWGNKFFPGFGDRYLAKNGYQSQMEDIPLPKNYRDNLFNPVPGPFGIHGRFDDQAKKKDLHFLWVTHQNSLSILIFISILLVIILVFW